MLLLSDGLCRSRARELIGVDRGVGRSLDRIGLVHSPPPVLRVVGPVLRRPLIRYFGLAVFFIMAALTGAVGTMNASRLKSSFRARSTRLAG